MGQTYSLEFLQRRLDEVRQEEFMKHEKQRIELADEILRLEGQLEVVLSPTDVCTLSVIFRQGEVPRVDLQEVVNEVAELMNRLATDYPRSGYRHYSTTVGHPGVQLTTKEGVYYQ